MQAPSSRQCGLRIALMTVATSWFTEESPKEAVKPLRRECRVVSAEPVGQRAHSAQFFAR
jgi:hypothetical protein